MNKGRAPSLLGALIGVMVLAGMTTAVLGQMNAWMQTSNNNRILQVQRDGGVQPDSGQVGVAFYGHSAFKVTSPRGLTILVDPWRNDPSGAWGTWYKQEFPMTRADIGMSTHAHFDHDALDRLDAIMLLDRMAGSFELGGVKITGIADKHVCVSAGTVKWTDAVKEFNQDRFHPTTSPTWTTTSM